jgi:probable DNA metabolism protein
MYTFVCENSIDGIFTGVYDAWASKYGHQNVRLISDNVETFELFQEYITVIPDCEKSEKVARTLRNRLSDEVYSLICQAILATELTTRKKSLDKADCIYHAIVLGLAMPDGSKLLQALGNSYVQRIFELSRATSNESHHLLGFLRFSELENQVLFSTIHPKNHVLPILAEHFTDRLPMENFIIYDENRKLAIVHKSGMNYLIVDASSLDQDIIKRYSQKELEYRKLWCSFFESIAIDARKNPNLQSQNIPKRFWKDAVELADLSK